MAVVTGNAFERGIDRFVRWVILPVTGIVPVLIRTGLLFAGFAALWVAFWAALVLQPSALDAAWAAITSLPLVAQVVVWVLFLPLTAALWAWQTDWPLVLRVIVVVGIGAWNLLVFLPRRGATAEQGAAAVPGAD
jgi:hypothetical protein